MKKLTFGLLALYINILAAFSQTAPDSAHYKARKLTLKEVDFVSGYYHQNGNNSAVTGGVGTERLTDISNTIDLKLVRRDRKEKQHTLSLQVGIDHYTSASSDNIDPAPLTSASYNDTRFYPSVAYAVKDKKKGLGYGGGVYYSNEADYTSYGISAQFSKASKDNNREASLKLQSFFDQMWIIRPIELRNDFTTGPEYRPRRSNSGSFTLSQVVHSRLQVAFMVDVVQQKGFLSTPFHRVYFTDHALKTEQLPETRLKTPVGVRANYFWGDRVIMRSLYRYYKDDWGVKAHTLNLEMPVKLTPFLSVSPYYRFYSQSAAHYFAPYKSHRPEAQLFSSDFDLSHFRSHYIGGGFRLVPAKGVAGIKNWNTLEIRYGHYTRTNGLQADMVTFSTTFK